MAKKQKWQNYRSSQNKNNNNMYYRRKILLALLQEFGGRLDRTDFQKYLFLLTREQATPSFDFVPYKYGGFSFQSYADKRIMIGYGLLKNSENWFINDKADYVAQLTSADRQAVLKVKREYGALKGKRLVRHVYRKYPYYAIKSEIAADCLSEDELTEVNRYKPTQTGYTFFTIGYEGKTFDYYLNQLVANNIRVLCDVRKNPFSMKYGFSKSQLMDACNKLGIDYIHFPELGIESEKRKNLEDKTDYEKLFKEYEKKTLPANKASFKKLYQVFLKNKRIAITCFEADYSFCHRHKIVKQIEKQPNWAFKIEHL